MPLSTIHAVVALVCATVAVAVAATPLPPRFLPAYEAQGAVDGWHMYYDGPGLRYRQDVVAYGSDTTIMLFYCDKGVLVKYTLSYPGQNHGPFDPTKSQSCSVKRTTNASCADAFAAMFQVPQYTSPFAFNPVYLPLAAPVRRGVPDDYVLTGEVPCPTSSGKCQQWNFTEASPKCGSWTSLYVTNPSTDFPEMFSWNPVFYSSQIGGCESYEDSTQYTLTSSSAPAASYIEGFARRVPSGACKVVTADLH